MERGAQCSGAERCRVGRDLILRFSLNPYEFKQFADDDEGVLRFVDCSRYRLGGTNDEGWFLGQCRYSKSAPKWGEFYEIAGTDPQLMDPTDWKTVSDRMQPTRHFLFYFRDETFECIAADWVFDATPDNALFQHFRPG